MISLASEAFRVIAISSGSQPNSRARSRRTLSIRGSSVCHMWIDRELVAEPEVPDHLLEHVGRGGAASAVVEVDHRAVGVEGALDLDPEVLVVRGAALGPPDRGRKGPDTRRSASGRKVGRAATASAADKRPAG